MKFRGLMITGYYIVKKPDKFGEMGDFCLLCNRYATEQHFSTSPYHGARFLAPQQWVTEAAAHQRQN